MTDLANHLEEIEIHSSPVALAYENDENVKSLVTQSIELDPILDFCREDNLSSVFGEFQTKLPEN